MGAGREPLSPALARVVAQAYAVFVCTAPPDLGVCRQCCMDPEIEADFLNHAPQDLPETYVQDWYFAAVEAEDGVVVHKEIAQWIMPRILEMLAQGATPSNSGEEVVLQRLAAGRPGRWSSEQASVLADFRDRYLDLLPDRQGGPQLDDILCMFVLAGFDPTQLTRHLMAWPDDVLVNMLWRDWVHWPRVPRIWRTAFWEANSAPAAHVWDWYHSDALLERVTRIALDPAAPESLRTKAVGVEAAIRSDL